MLPDDDWAEDALLRDASSRARVRQQDGRRMTDDQLKGVFFPPTP